MIDVSPLSLACVGYGELSISNIFKDHIFF